MKMKQGINVPIKRVNSPPILLNNLYIRKEKNGF